MDTKKTRYVDAWRNNLRSWKILWNLRSLFFVSTVIDEFLGALLPYTTIWISARIIGELAGERKPEALTKWVILEISLALVLGLLKYLTSRWAQYENGIVTETAFNNKPLTDKFYTMDFADIDKQYVHDLFNRIRQNAMFSNYGFETSIFVFTSFTKGIFEIVGGIILSINLFLLPVPKESSLSVLNNPVFILILLICMVAASIIGGKLDYRGHRYWIDYADKARFGNRFYSFFGFEMTDRKRAVDVRMYEQYRNVAGLYMKKESVFGGNSEIAGNARGPMGFVHGLAEGVTMLPTAAIYLFVCLKSYGGAFGVGLVTQYIGACTYLFTGIKDFMECISRMHGNSEFLDLIFELIDLPNNMYQGSLTTEKRMDNKYEVEFKNVSFKYPGTENYALKNVNVKFTVGEKLAVVGMNGSGKTTFIKLLCRLYDPDEGEILLNGINIRKYRYDEYINIFSVVFQDFKLLGYPLGENVAGRSSYDKEKALRCLKEAGFNNLDDKMKNGLDTYLYKDIDKEGIEISGGEAQKIALARALYKDAPFIILDEPTAALDPIAEAEIYEKFNDIVGGRTAVYISHRLSSCKFCDEIMVFHEGNIVQKGSHAQLLSDKNGKYYELWNAQAQYYNDDVKEAC